MAIYHFHAQIIGRSDGRSSVGAAAYRLGVALADELTGEVFDYTRKQGVESWHTLAPAGAPDWVNDPATLWNAVEAAEKRKDSQLCREVDVALPAELTHDQMKALALDFAREQWVERGMVAVLAFHDLDSHNPHFHAMLTMRDIGPEGFGKKNRDWNAKGLLETWREQWATHANTVLEAAGHSTRIDHRTLDAQKADATEREDFAAAAALDRPATKHEGPATTQARRSGRVLPRADRNDRITTAAAKRFAAHSARFAALEAQAKAQGRLQPVDLQALHARALLERTQAGQARLRKAYNPTPTNQSHPHGKSGPQHRPAAPLTRDSRHRGSHGHSGHAHGLGALPAVRPLNLSSTCRRPDGNPGGPGRHAAGPGGLLRAHASGPAGASSPMQRLRAQRGSVAPRAPSARTRGGLPEGGGKVERLAELRATLAATASMEKAIAAILAGAAQALARPQALTPWQRSTARSVLETHQAQTEALAAIDTAAEKRTQTRARLRLARADANDTSPATGVAAAALRAVGLTPAQDKEAQAMRDALARAKRRHGQAKRAHEDAKQAHQQAATAAEKARADFAGAFGLEVPRFDAKPAPQPSAASSTRPRPFQKLDPTPNRRPGPPHGGAPNPRRF